MALSAAGYPASGAGTTAANGNYVPVTGASATSGGATQYTFGIYYLSFCTSPGGPLWQITTTVNAAYNSPGQLYYVPNPASTTNMPLTGWVLSNGAAPAPVFNAVAAASIQPRVMIF